MNMMEIFPWIIVFLYLLIPLSLVLTLMGIYNIMKNPANDQVLRLTWVVILIFIPFVGFLYYLFIYWHQATKGIIRHKTKLSLKN